MKWVSRNQKCGNTELVYNTQSGWSTLFYQKNKKTKKNFIDVTYLKTGNIKYLAFQTALQSAIVLE